MTTFTLDKSSIQWSMITCILETIECAKHKLHLIIPIACTDHNLICTYYHHMFPKDCRFIITILTTGFRLIHIGDTLEIIVNSFLVHLNDIKNYKNIVCLNKNNIFLKLFKFKLK